MASFYGQLVCVLLPRTSGCVSGSYCSGPAAFANGVNSSGPSSEDLSYRLPGDALLLAEFPSC